MAVNCEQDTLCPSHPLELARPAEFLAPGPRIGQVFWRLTNIYGLLYFDNLCVHVQCPFFRIVLQHYQ